MSLHGRLNEGETAIPTRRHFELEKEIGRGCHGGYCSYRHGDEAVTVLAETAGGLSVFEVGKRGDAFSALGAASRCWRL